MSAKRKSQEMVCAETADQLIEEIIAILEDDKDAVKVLKIKVKLTQIFYRLWQKKPS